MLIFLKANRKEQQTKKFFIMKPPRKQLVAFGIPQAFVRSFSMM